MHRFFFVLILMNCAILHAQNVNAIKAYLNEGKYESAEKACSELIESQPSNAELQCLLGDIYSVLNSYGNAIACYNQAIKLNPVYADAYAKRGHCHYAIRDMNSARLDLINASYYDRSAVNYFNLGKVEQQMGKLNEALQSYRSALKKDSTLTAIYRYRSEIYMAKHKYLLAMRDIDSSLKESPFDDALFTQRGTALLGMRKNKEAFQMFNRAIRLKNHNAAAYYGRGRAKFEMKDYRGAIADFDTTIINDKSFHLAYFNRALSRLEISQRNTDDACSDFKKAASLSYTEALSYIRKYCE